MLGEPRLGEVADLGCFTIWLFRTLFLSDPDSASSSAALVIAGSRSGSRVGGGFWLSVSDFPFIP